MYMMTRLLLVSTIWMSSHLEGTRQSHDQYPFQTTDRYSRDTRRGLVRAEKEEPSSRYCIVLWEDIKDSLVPLYLTP